jgi:hypothetical protein
LFLHLITISEKLEPEELQIETKTALMNRTALRNRTATVLEGDEVTRNHTKHALTSVSCHVFSVCACPLKGKREKNWRRPEFFLGGLKRPEVACMGTAGLPTMHGPKRLPFDDELN